MCVWVGVDQVSSRDQVGEEREREIERERDARDGKRALAEG